MSTSLISGVLIQPQWGPDSCLDHFVFSSYCLPILNSLIDLSGQVLLLVAFELSALLGADVRVKEVLLPELRVG